MCFRDALTLRGGAERFGGTGIAESVARDYAPRLDCAGSPALSVEAT